MAWTVYWGVSAETVSKKLVLLLPSPWIRITVSIPSPAVSVEIRALPAAPRGCEAAARARCGRWKNPSKATARSRLPRAQSRRERKASRPESWPSRSSSQVAASVPITASGSRSGETRDLAAILVELDGPAQPEVVELDPVAGAEAGIGAQIALGEGGERLLHLAQPLPLGRDLSQGRGRVPPRTVVPAHTVPLNRLLTEYACFRRPNSIRAWRAIRIQDTLSGEARELQPGESRRGRDLRLRADRLRADPHRQRAARTSSSRC